MSVSFLTPAEFIARAAMPSEYADACEQLDPGWLQKQLEMKSAWISARLCKRYADFVAPYPDIVLDWLTSIVTVRVWLRRGRDPEDEQAKEYKEEAVKAEAEILEAANSETGLFDLPLRGDVPGTGISRGGPFGYSERSPYVFADEQREIGRIEDFNGGGSYV